MLHCAAMKMLNQQTLYFPTKATNARGSRNVHSGFLFYLKKHRVTPEGLTEKKTRKNKADQQGGITLLSYGT